MNLDQSECRKINGHLETDTKFLKIVLHHAAIRLIRSPAIYLELYYTREDDITSYLHVLKR